MVGVLKLARGEERRLKAGHLWIYRDEVTELDVSGPGGLVHVLDSRGHALGTAYANPESKIVARMMSRKALDSLKPAWWQDRLNAALQIRQWLFDAPFYRWVHGEGDKLPGLVIDRFGHDVVIQAHTAGMDVQMNAIVDAVVSLVQPENVYVNNRAASRRHEGLAQYARLMRGDGDGVVTAMEDGIAMRCHALEGQKTGYFYDQRPNRRWIGAHCQGRRVLDLFSYVGAFAVQALQGGASEVVSVDASATALDWARQNIAAAGYAQRWQGMKGDVTQQLRQMAEEKQRFDIVICDPPAYVKSRQKVRQGLQGYQHLATHACHLLKAGGMFCAASCSGLVSMEDFRRATVAGIRQAGRAAQLVHEAGAGADHPWLPAMPETRYLKFITFMLD